MSEDTTGQQEFTHGSVPESATVSGWKIAFILVASMVSLPAFVVGAQIGTSFGFKIGALSVVIGALFLAMLACLTGLVARNCRLTTAMIIETAFGKIGAKLINLILALTILGWFGVITRLFGQSIGPVAEMTGVLDLDPRVYMILGGALMTITTVFGFGAIQKLASLVVPFLLMGLMATAWMASKLVAPEILFATPLDAPSLGLGISIVVGGLAAGVTVFPDFGRFSRRNQDAILAAVMGFAVGMPAVLILSSIPSIATGEHELTTILASLGLGVPALLLLVLSAWTANAGNLYSSALTLATIFTKQRHSTLTIAAGSVGILLAILGISDYLIPFLTILGIGIPPIAGIYVADFFFLRRGVYLAHGTEKIPAFRPLAMVSWVIAIAVGAASSQYFFTLSSVPALDSIATAFVCYLALGKLMAGRKAVA